MTTPLTSGGTGRCLCGAVHYRYEGEPTTIGLCQCERCQRQSGSAFLIGVIFPKEAVTIEGPLATLRLRLTASTGCGVTFVRPADRRCRSRLSGIQRFDQ